MAIVGAYARIDPDDVPAVRGRIESLPGISIFDLDEPAKVGIIIESDDVDAAHEKLTRHVRGVEGVWGVWPVYVHFENDLEGARQAISESV
jgi:nitrate reductase NapAB chaperone NapD